MSRPRGPDLLVRLAAQRLPRERRPAFLREWRAELEAEADHLGGGRLLLAAAGAWWDAGAIRRYETNRERGDGMTGWARELGQAGRGLLRAPGFTAVTVLTLGLGLGGAATVFSLLDGVALAPLPYPESDRLVRLQNQVPGVGPEERWSLSTAQWVYFQDELATVESVGLLRGTGGTVQTTEGPERVTGVMVTHSVLDLLGASAVQGRLFTVEEDDPGSPRVALLSHGFWTRVLGADPGVVGTTLHFSGRPVEVVGVLAPALHPPGWPPTLQPELWLPLQVDPAGPFGNSHVFPAVARLAPEATPASAEAEIARLTPRLPETFPNVYSEGFFERYGFRTEAVPLKSSVLGTLDRNLWMAFGGVLLVLLVAAANVANLFAVRLEARDRELSIRTALGAGRSALARHLLAEGSLLAAAGATLALLGAWMAVPLVAGLAPADLPRITDLALTPGAILLTLCLAALSAGILTLGPFLARGRGDVHVLASSTRTSAGRGVRRLRSGLVVGQVALALTLSVGAALLLQTMRGLQNTDLGFRPEGSLAVSLHLDADRYPDDQALWGFYRELLERVEALPGVEQAALGEELPVQGGFGCTVQAFADETVYARVEAAGRTTCAGQTPVTPGYFEALGIPIVQGRALEDGDLDDPSRGSVVVSRAFADRFWPGDDPLGKGVAPSGRTEPPYYRVVGVAGDVPARSSSGNPPLSETAVAIYYPVTQHPDTPERWGYWWPGSMGLVVRTAGTEPLSLLPAVRSLVHELDPEIPLADATSLSQVVREATSELAFLSIFMLTAAGVALALSAVGLWGVVAYVVGRRSREIGMRLAIGADPRGVVWMVTLGSVRWTLVGLALGGILAALGTRVLEGVLVGVSPLDPLAWGGAATLLLVVAVLAAWLPARRAARVDPSEALRSE